ncbi:Aste57867_18657 [Aphanomyces stellatus]|uniref:Aste57867_18657 protein n=1 Tax=Aphanomyces stellatus TaxID=120398 RepID=A0A485LCD6_9STRA|nr:hypothetical protein As57867_018595 [Aphanomyces stellatus]VFT95392.1 Aste57867_18657 [Aphanomyces stellatus]
MEEPFIRLGRELMPTEKMAFVTMLQNTLRDGKLPYGTIQSISVVFKVHRNSVAKLWNSYKQGSIATKKTGRVGPKQRYSKDEIVSLVQDVPQRQRSTMRDVAEATGISRAMVCRSLKTGFLQRRTSSLKPLLTDPKKMERSFTAWRTSAAIKTNFPSANKMVVLQQDNATPHRSINNAVLSAVSTDGGTFVVGHQPPNSPNLKVVSRSIDDVIHAILMAFDMLDVEKLEDIFLTLQDVMTLVLEHRGGNFFILPHLKKDALRRAGTLMANVTCPVSNVREAELALVQNGVTYNQ